MKSSNNQISKRFGDSFSYALELHGRQTRKGTSIPYIAHLMSVAALVIENGGDEDLAIAALLHDAIEDQGGIETLEVIQTRFGEQVARIVFECSDALVTPKPPWRERKENYLAHLITVGEDTRLVSLADKLHNARSILADLEQLGQAVWERFNGGKAGTLWYYRTLADFFLKQIDNSQLAHELNRVVQEIERLAAVVT